MRRAPGLFALSRRDFCGLAAATGVGLAVAGCTDGSTGAIETGPLGGGDDQPPVDAAVQLPDAAPMATCGSGAVDVGLPSTFTMNAPVYFSAQRMFVVRDVGGLYALTARCTHEGVACAVSSGRFRCPRHGALFTLNGAIISGPVSQPLVHYAMCTLANGHVGVTTTSTVPASTRLVA